ncbi:MAG TPA: hypothetical protein VMO47_14455 [Rhodothermales bacterium]|nr:hypothetical protein [Rhodothermales bacterium]
MSLKGGVEEDIGLVLSSEFLQQDGQTDLSGCRFGVIVTETYGPYRHGAPEFSFGR